MNLLVKSQGAARTFNVLECRGKLKTVVKNSNVTSSFSHRLVDRGLNRDGVGCLHDFPAGEIIAAS